MVQPTPPCSLCEKGLCSPVPLTMLSLEVRLFKKHLITLLRTKCCICEKKNQLFKKANLQLTGKKVCRLGGLSTIHLVLYSPNFVVHYMGLHIKYRKHCSPQLTQGQQQQEQKRV